MLPLFDFHSQALLICFRLHESRIMVVSSTAAATLRQLVMFVVDKVVEEDKRLESLPSEDLQDIILPDNSTRSLGPSARDAFAVFEDLCLLANAEKPNFLKLESLPKTFALELIESVVTNYHELFRKASMPLPTFKSSWLNLTSSTKSSCCSSSTTSARYSTR